MKTNNSILQNIEKDLYKRTKKSYTIEIGIISGDSEERDLSEDIKKHGSPSPHTNAELLYLNCNGSGPNHIPKRDVLQYTIDDWNNKIKQRVLKDLSKKILDPDWNEKKADAYMDKVAEMLGGHCRDLIQDRDKRITPNSKKTIELKGSDTPLIDTGQMRRAIVGRVKK